MCAYILVYVRVLIYIIRVCVVRLYLSCTVYLIFPFNFHFHINFLWFKFLFPVHYLVVDVAALQFVGPSTWMYNLTTNIFILFLLFSHYLVVDVAALQFVGPSTWVYKLTPNILTLLFLIYFIFTLPCGWRGCIAVCWSLNVSV